MRHAYLNRVTLPCVRICLLCLAVLAANPSEALAQTNVPDYGAGFQKLISLGLPDSKGATYMRLDGMGGGGMMGMEHLTGNRLRLAGNAWRLKDAGKDGGTFIVNNCYVTDVISQAAWQREWQARMKEASAAGSASRMQMMMGGDPFQMQDRMPGTWREADAMKDATNIIAFLSQPDDKQKRREMAMRSGAAVSFFLSAAHFHRNGLEKEANRIAHLVLAKAPSRKKVLEGAVARLADVEFAKTYRRFSRGRDWKAFEQDLSKLLARYTKGWSKRPAIERLRSTAAARIAGAPPPISGELLSDEDQALALELGTATNAPATAGMLLQSHGMGLWLLSPPERKRPEGAPEPSIVERITARGMKSIPLLTALLEDTYLTNIDNQNAMGAMSMMGGMYDAYSYMDDFDGDMPSHMQAQMQAQMMKQMYRMLPRPLSRGEIAMALLQQVVPLSNEERYSDELEPKDLKERVDEWYQANQSKSAAELARAYLGGEDFDQQQMAAIQYLSRHGTEADLATVEQSLLEGDPMQQHSMAYQYVQQRGDKARAFVEKYIAKLEGPPKDSGTQDTARLFRSPAAANKQWAERVVKQFKELLITESAAELLAGLVAEKVKIAAVQARLQRSLAREETDTAITQLLTTASQVKDAQTATHLLGLVASVPHMKQSRQMMAGSMEWMEEQVEFKMPDLSKHADLWRKLLDDTREVNTGYGWGGTTVGSTAASMIDTMYVGENMFNVDYSAQQLGRRLAPLVKKRAELRLAGKKTEELPPLPSAVNVSAKDREAMLAAIRSAAPSDLKKRVAALGLDEMLVLMEEAASDTELSKSLKPIANVITTVSIKPEDPGLAAKLAKARGKPLSRETIDTLLAACKERAKAGNATVFTASRMPCLEGMTVTVKSMEAGETSPWAHYARSAAGSGNSDPFVSGTVQGGDVHAMATWKVKETTADAEDAAARKQKEMKEKLSAMMEGGDVPEDALEMLEQLDTDESYGMFGNEKDFWEAVTKFCAGDVNVCTFGSVTFASIIPGSGDGEDDDDMDMMYMDEMMMID